MSIDIELNTQIKGIQVNNIELKQSLFADDASFILDGSRISFETLIKIIDEFAAISGLTLNRHKCKILKIGALKNSPIEFCKHKQFIWNSNHASTLGIEFSNEPREIMSLNIPAKVHAFETCLNKWKRWKLSLIGKITVLKIFAIPKLVYPLTVLPNPSHDIISKIKSQCFQFLWDKKPDKIARKRIIQDYTDGGLKMLDIDLFLKSIKASWVKRLLFQPDSKLMKIYTNMLSNYGGMLILKSDYLEKEVKDLNIKSEFLRNSLCGWLSVSLEKDEIPIQKQIIWKN